MQASSRVTKRVAASAIGVWICLIACSSSRPATSSQPREVSGSEEAHTPAPSDDGSCRASPEQTEGQACVLDGPSCPYDAAPYSGTICECVAGAQCGGVYVDAFGRGAMRCRAPPGVPRADGCPLSIPPEGHPCPQVGQACAFDGPCPGLGDRDLATCAEAGWHLEQQRGTRPP
jgi:hypothetical protein